MVEPRFKTEVTLGHVCLLSHAIASQMGDRERTNKGYPERAVQSTKPTKAWKPEEQSPNLSFSLLVSSDLLEKDIKEG